MSTRGWCPTLSTPMQTGDGLLARLILHEPIAISKLSVLCLAAEAHGNGIIEVTQRGSLQIRGLSESSAPMFAQAVTSLEVGVGGGPPFLTSPLLGLDAYEPFVSSALAPSLLSVLNAGQRGLESLGPKVSVLIDGGGKLHLDSISADIRLVAVCDPILHLSLAGNAENARHLGYVAMNHAAATVEVLLRMLAGRGSSARARDLVCESVIQELRRALGGSLIGDLPANSRYFGDRQKGRGPVPRARAPAEPIGTHHLNNGTLALGFALPFGHTTTTVLRHIAQVAADHGASSIRPAPGRALLAIGLSQSAANRLREAVAAKDFVVDPRDARRHVIACAGAPACASAKLATRQLAPEVARATQGLAGSSRIVHLAGCSKGCAHPGQAAVTIVGPDRVILNGRASDTPYTTISSAGLIADITRLCSDL
jgi:precorrin-3B synthase